MILAVDVGNSRIKWARVGEAGLTDHGSAPLEGSPGEWLGGLGEALVEPIEHIVVANVAGERAAVALEAFARDRGAKLSLVRPAKSQFGVRCAYADPERLGADRWVGVVAAHRLLDGACAVIDAGTTVTLDVVDRNGEHLGGLIMAGPTLVARTLGRETSGIGVTEPALGAATGIAILGASTNAAVAHGTMIGIAAGLDRAIAQIAVALREPLTTVLTGGAGPLLEPWLETDVIYRPHFVLEGLAEIAKNA